MEDPAKSCSFNIASNILTADSAIACGNRSNTYCANENSDEDYLNIISLEYESIEKKEPPLNGKPTKTFQDLI